MAPVNTVADMRFDNVERDDQRCKSESANQHDGLPALFVHATPRFFVHAMFAVPRNLRASSYGLPM